MTLDDLRKMAHEVSSSPSIHHSETVALARAVLALADVAETAARFDGFSHAVDEKMDAFLDLLSSLPPEVTR